MQLTKSNAAKGAGAIAIATASHRSKAKGLEVCCAASEPALRSFWIDPKLSAPFSEEHALPAIFNPSCIAANVSASDRPDSWNNPHCFIKGPSVIQPADSGVLGNSKSFSPFSNAKGFSIVIDALVCAPIALLLFACSPLAVLLAISKVVVNSFNRMPIWRLPHVEKKISEVSPFVTHSYSPSPVVVPLFEIRVGAALNNSIPYGIGASSMRPMLSSSYGRYFPVKTSARFCFSAIKVLRCAYRFRTTIAFASPAPSINSLNCNKSSEALKGQILRSGNDIARMAAIDSFSHGKRLSAKFLSALRACFCNEGHNIFLRKMCHVF